MFEVYSTVAYHACVFRGVVFPFNIISVTAFDLFTFFRADLIQSEASWKLSSTSDWLMSVWKEFELIKWGHTFGLFAVKWNGYEFR